jgi:hypothetical protein
MPNNTKKTNKNTPIAIIGPKTSNTQAFGTYASNKGGRRRRQTRKSRARK